MNTLNYTTRNRRYGWLSVLIGIFSIIIGIWCVCTPAESLEALTLLFIVGLFGEGIMETALALATAGSPNWGWRLAAGLLALLLGVWVLLLEPQQATVILIYIVGFWIFFSSVMGIAESCQLSALRVRGWGWLMLFSIIGLVCSFLFLLGPAIGGFFTVIFAGAAFIAYGCFRCAMAKL